MVEQNQRQKIVNTMRGWLGYKESDGTHKKIIDIYNAHKPLAVGYKVKYTDAWCAATVSAAFISAGLTSIAPTECSCPRMIELYKQRNRWQESDAYTPQPGDIVMYDWQDTGVGDNTGMADHVGIVESISGNQMTILEGNLDNAVGRRTLAVNGKYIRGYCLPEYAVKRRVYTGDRKIVQERTGFDDNTMAWMETHRFPNDFFRKLANAMKQGGN
jgi:hypothetical protein